MFLVYTANGNSQDRMYALELELAEGQVMYLEKQFHSHGTDFYNVSKVGTKYAIDKKIKFMWFTSKAFEPFSKPIIA